MSSSSGTLEEAKERFYEDLEDPDKAFEQAEHWSEDAPREYGVASLDGHHPKDKFVKGQKKLQKIPKVTKPLPGEQKLSVDEKIRAVVALQTMGLPTRRIEDILGMSRKYANDLACRYPQAWDAAQADMVKYTQQKYNSTMNYVIGALSEAAPIALNTFKELMEDKDTSSTNRLKAAKCVMDMMMERGRNIVADPDRKAAIAGAKMLHANNDSEYIIDAEDVENGG